MECHNKFLKATKRVTALKNKPELNSETGKVSHTSPIIVTAGQTLRLVKSLQPKNTQSNMLVLKVVSLFSFTKKMLRWWLIVYKHLHRRKISDSRRVFTLADKGITRCNGWSYSINFLYHTHHGSIWMPFSNLLTTWLTAITHLFPHPLARGRNVCSGVFWNIVKQKLSYICLLHLVLGVENGEVCNSP